MLWKDYTVIDIYVATKCGLSDKLLLCTGLNFLSIPAKEYELKMLNYCGEEETIISPLVRVKTNIITSSDLLLKFEEIEDIKLVGTFSFTYEFPLIMNSRDKLEILLRKKDNETKIIPFYLPTDLVIKKYKTVVLTKTIDSVEEEVYKLVTKYKDLDVEYVYDKEITVIRNSPLKLSGDKEQINVQYLTAHLNDKLNSIEIDFDSVVFKERIIKISFRKPNSLGSNLAIEDYEVGDNTIRIINSNEKLDSEGTFTIQIEDVLNENYFIYIIVPSSVQYDSYINYDDSKEIEFTFEEKEIPSLIKAIKEFNDEIILFSNLQLSADNNTIKASFEFSNTALTIYHINGVKFYDAKGNWIITQMTPITFISKQFKLSLKSKSITLYQGDSKLFIESSTPLYDEIKTSIQIQSKDDECNIETIFSNYIEITCPFFTTVGNFTLTISVINEQFSVDEETNMIQVQILSTLSSGGEYVIDCGDKVLYNNSCYATCNEIFKGEAMIFRNGNSCSGECKGYYYQKDSEYYCSDICDDTEYKYYLNYMDPTGIEMKKCVSECPKVYYKNKCYESCDNIEGIKMYQQSKDDDKCVPSCSNFSYKGICYSDCTSTSTENLYESGKECIDNCPFYFYEESSTKKCIDNCTDISSGEYYINYINQNQCILCDKAVYNNTCYDNCIQVSTKTNRTLYTNDNKCYEECPLPLLGDFDTKTCVNSCAESYSYKGKYCYKDCDDIPEANETKIVKDNVNKVCSTCPSFTVYSDKTCVEKCSSNQYAYKMTCYSSCQQVIDLHLATSLYQFDHLCSSDSCKSQNKKYYVSKIQCTNNCDSSGFTSVNVCIDNCQSVDLYEQGDKCVSRCSDNYGLYTDASNNVKCIQCNDTEKFELIGDECCKKGKCPTLYTYNDNES